MTQSSPYPSRHDRVSLHGIRKGFAPAAMSCLVWIGKSRRGKKIALVGRNGSGKTTLMGIGRRTGRADAGTVTLDAARALSRWGDSRSRDRCHLVRLCARSTADLLDLRHKAVEMAGEVAPNPMIWSCRNDWGQFSNELNMLALMNLELQVDACPHRA